MKKNDIYPTLVYYMLNNQQITTRLMIEVIQHTFYNKHMSINKQEFYMIKYKFCT